MSQDTAEDLTFEELYHRAMEAYRATKLPHGLCHPVERNACTHCIGMRKLDQMLREYKGRKVVLA